jgi:hypothetical protein
MSNGPNFLGHGPSYHLSTPQGLGKSRPGEEDLAQVSIVAWGVDVGQGFTCVTLSSKAACFVKLYTVRFESGEIEPAEQSAVKHGGRFRAPIDIVIDARCADDGNPLCDDNY